MQWRHNSNTVTRITWQKPVSASHSCHNFLFIKLFSSCPVYALFSVQDYSLVFCLLCPILQWETDNACIVSGCKHRKWSLWHITSVTQMLCGVLFDYSLLNVLRNMFLICSSITHMCLQKGKFWLLANVVFFFFPISWDLQVQYCLYYVINQQVHINEICFIIYYSPTRFGRFCDQNVSANNMLMCTCCLWHCINILIWNI